MKKSILLVAAAAVSFSLSAQTLPSLLVSQDAAGTGAASATVAAKPCAYSLETNVASMSFFEGTAAVGVSYGMWQPSFANDKLMGAGAVARFGKLAVGLAAKKLSQPEYTITNDNGVVSQVNGTFAPSETSVALGAAFAVTENISLGATGRMVQSELGTDARAGVFGADVAAFYSKDALSLGLSVNNIGGKVNYGGDDYDQPMLAKAGGAYSLAFGETSALRASVEADLIFKGGFMAGAGAEYSYNDMIFARCGYHLGDNAKAVPSYASVGLGIKFAGVSLDAAFLTASETLGNSLFFGLGYSF